MAAHALAAQARSDHRHANIVTQFVVIRCSVNHMRICRSVGADGVHRQLGFTQFERALGGGDQHQNALGARQIDAFKQWAGHSLLGGNARAVGAIGYGRAHHGFARLAHHGTHVFKVDVDVAVLVDDFGNAAYRVFEHIVGMGESFVLGHVIAQYFEQLFIQHNNQ